MRLKVPGHYLLAAFIAVPLTFLGLKLYFNDQRLAQTLTLQYPGSTFEVPAGQAVTEGNEISVTDTLPEGRSLISQSGLSIDSRFYHQLVLNFSHKATHQPVTIRVHHNGKNSPSQQPVLYTHQKVRRFDLTSFIPEDSLITAIELEADLLLAPYRLQSLTVEPKYFTIQRFALLLWESFSTETTRLGQPLNQTKTLITPKGLVLCYLVVFSLVYLLLAQVFQWSIRALWWVIIMVGWLLLDGRYLFEKTRRVKSNQQIYAHLSAAEKAKKSSTVAALAQTILSAVPPADGRKKIYLRWEELSTGIATFHEKRTPLADQIKYYLYPHEIVLSTHGLPKKPWLETGFYWIESTEDSTLFYDEKQATIQLANGEKITARRLLKKSGITIYALSPTLETPKK